MSIAAIAGSILRLVTTVIDHVTKKNQRREEAATKFLETFHEQLNGLYPEPASWPKGTGIEKRLRDVYPALQQAVADFRPYVPKSKQAAFESAWMWYHTETKRPQDQTYTQYMNMSGAGVSHFGGIWRRRNNGQKTFKRNVDRLLKFAN